MAANPVELGSQQIDVWQAALDMGDLRLGGLYATLSAEEQARAGRFYFPRDRARFIAAHGMVREILGQYLEMPAGRLEFSSNEFGKPALAGALTDRLSFNLSHSADLMMIAVTRGREVGIDVEAFLPERADSAVARNYFSPSEVACLEALPQAARARAFFNCWTRKEAYIKARGSGLSIPLDSFDVSLEPGQPAELLRTAAPEEARGWQLRHLDLGEHYVGALAASGSGWAFTVRRWKQVRAATW